VREGKTASVDWAYSGPPIGPVEISRLTSWRVDPISGDEAAELGKALNRPLDPRTVDLLSARLSTFAVDMLCGAPDVRKARVRFLKAVVKHGEAAIENECDPANWLAVVIEREYRLCETIAKFTAGQSPGLSDMALAVRRVREFAAKRLKTVQTRGRSPDYAWQSLLHEVVFTVVALGIDERLPQHDDGRDGGATTPLFEFVAAIASIASERALKVISKDRSIPSDISKAIISRLRSYRGKSRSSLVQDIERARSSALKLYGQLEAE
jgi:hypothetical protein